MNASARPPLRPGTALALGSGSARGLAHIGILRVLAEAGVPVRGVAGTSIGSVIGGVYCGNALDGYESLMRGLDRQGVLWFLDPVLPTAGFFGGARTSQLLRTLLGDRRIELLPIAYCAVACDLATGHEVRLREGDVVDAIRASSAIPGVFTPWRIGERWLIDGGAVSPVPIGAAKALGFSHSIAIDLHAASFPEPAAVEAAAAPQPAPPSPPPPLAELPIDQEAVERLRDFLQQTAGLVGEARRRFTSRALRFWTRLTARSPARPPGLAEIVGDSMAFAQLGISRIALELDSPDLLLAPRLPGIGLFDFHRAAAIIAEGERCAREAWDLGRLDPMIEAGRERKRHWFQTG